MFNQEHLQEKWAPLLDYEGLDPIKDSHRRMVTAVLLENQERALREEREFLYEAPTVNTQTTGTPGFSGGASSPVAGFDPVLISLIRRSMPNLVAYDLAGVQPMNGPTGLIFAMRSRYTNQSGSEAFYNEVDTAFSGQNAALGLTDGFTDSAVGLGTTAQQGTNPGLLNPIASATGTTYNVGQGMRTDDAEDLGTQAGGAFNEMAFSIEKVTVTAKSRALKAEYSLELAQDLKAIHGLNAEAELANILSSEILAEINREVIRTIYNVAETGATVNTATAGTSSALTMAGVLDYTPALNANLNVDDTGNTFAGVLAGKFRVYIDPYAANVSANQYYVVGYKGSSPYDAGIFYCPYVPLQMVRAVGENTFQPKIGFKTRYGIVANPFAKGATLTNPGVLERNSNVYYRRVKVANLM